MRHCPLIVLAFALGGCATATAPALVAPERASPLVAPTAALPPPVAMAPAPGPAAPPAKPPAASRPTPRAAVPVPVAEAVPPVLPQGRAEGPPTVAPPVPPAPRAAVAAKPAKPAEKALPPPVVPPRGPAPAAPTLAILVIDGDTVDINGARWRLANVDAPEIGGRATCDRERDLGEKARRRLQQMLGSGRVETDTRGVRDTQNRLLGTIRVSGRDVGEMLVAEGLARKHGARVPLWCDARTPPKAKVAKAAPGACKGLGRPACEAASGCRWIVHARDTDVRGRQLTDYCKRG